MKAVRFALLPPLLTLVAACNTILPLAGTGGGADAQDLGSADLDAAVADSGAEADNGAVDGAAADLPDAGPRQWVTLGSAGGGTPGRLVWPVAVYHAERQSVWLYGGIDEQGNVTGALWELKGGGWTQLCGDPAGSSSLPDCGPGPRFGHSLVYDTAKKRVLLYGGNTARSYGQAAGADLWAWPSGSVTAVKLCDPCDAGPRTQHYAAYDQQRQVMLIFGGCMWFGESSTNVLETLYELTVDDSWDGPLGGAATPPSARYSYRHSMTYVPAGPGVAPALAGKAVICGGRGLDKGALVDMDECWTRDATDWTRLCASCTGQPRVVSGLIFDRASRRLLLVGGFVSATKELAGTWTSADGSTWSLADAATPTARDTMALAYDELGQQVVLHGGNGAGCDNGVGVLSYIGNCGDTLLYTSSSQ